MSNKIKLLIILSTIGLIIFLSSIFTLEERKQAIILQFGEIKRIERDAGIKFKIPFIENIIFFDKRILDSAIKEKEIIAADQKTLITNAFTKYRITDPKKFYTTLNNQINGNQRLEGILESSLRQVIGGVELNRLLTEERSIIMSNIKNIVSEKTKIFGVDIIDVRIMRGDLPEENSNAIFRRMQTEREKEAREIRATGSEEAQKIIAKADKEKIIIISEAKKKAEITRGEGDAQSVKIFANAIARDPNFYEFYRSMNAYKHSLGSDNTRLIISPDSEFFKFFVNLK